MILSGQGDVIKECYGTRTEIRYKYGDKDDKIYQILHVGRILHHEYNGTFFQEEYQGDHFCPYQQVVCALRS